MALRHFALVCTLSLLAGCQSRLTDNRSLTVAAAETTTITIDAPKYDQLVTVAVTSDQPVHVAVYLKKDQAAVDAALDGGKKSDLVLASKSGVTSDKLEFKVPAKQEFIVRFDAVGKAANVQVKTQGK